MAPQATRVELVARTDINDPNSIIPVLVDPTGKIVISNPGGGGGGGASTIADAADVAQGAKADAAYTGSGDATVIGALKGLYALIISGTQKAIARGGAKGSTTAADVTSTPAGANHQALDIVVLDPVTGTAITSFGGAATENHLGSVGLNATDPSFAMTTASSPAFSTTPYTIDDVLGGVISLSVARLANGGGYIESLELYETTLQKPGIRFYLFSRTGLAGTYTDNAQVVYSTDRQYYLTTAEVQPGDWKGPSGSTGMNVASISLTKRIRASNSLQNIGVVAVMLTSSTLAAGEIGIRAPVVQD